MDSYDGVTSEHTYSSYWRPAFQEKVSWRWKIQPGGFAYTRRMNNGSPARQGTLWATGSGVESTDPQRTGENLGGRGVITAFCDGGARGNPGPAGFGVYIQSEDGEKVAELSEFLGIRTNNFAEYSGLLAALAFALDRNYAGLRVIADSELMVKQIKGQYRVKSPDLKPLYDEAKRRIARLGSFQIQHVLRGKNRQADRLANDAMDRGVAALKRPPAH